MEVAADVEQHRSVPETAAGPADELSQEAEVSVAEELTPTEIAELIVEPRTKTAQDPVTESVFEPVAEADEPPADEPAT